MFSKQLEERRKKDFFKSPDQPLSILADFLPPICVTTNYDNLMVKALEARHKDPRRELCRWNKYVEQKASVFDSAPVFEPTLANPVVFHLHGHDVVAEYLVLTEDDYLHFLVNISRRQNLLPPRIREARKCIRRIRVMLFSLLKEIAQ